MYGHWSWRPDQASRRLGPSKTSVPDERMPLDLAQRLRHVGDVKHRLSPHPPLLWAASAAPSYAANHPNSTLPCAACARPSDPVDRSLPHSRAHLRSRSPDGQPRLPVAYTPRPRRDHRRYDTAPRVPRQVVAEHWMRMRPSHDPARERRRRFALRASAVEAHLAVIPGHMVAVALDRGRRRRCRAGGQTASSALLVRPSPAPRSSRSPSTRASAPSRATRTRPDAIMPAS